MQQELIDEVSVFLLKNGFTVKALPRTAVDVLARRGSSVLLLKVLHDANALTSEVANEMKKIAGYLQAAPIIVAEKGGDKLVENVVYQRFGIFAVNFDTLRSCVKGEMPVFMKSNAGLTVFVDGDELKRVREQEEVSSSSLSRRIGISRVMLAKYENEKAEMGVRVAERLYDVFGERVFARVNMFKPFDELVSEKSGDYLKKYDELGFNAANVRKVPFDIIAKKKNEIILTEIGDVVKKEVFQISNLLDADNLVIFRKKKPKDVAALKKEEFLEFEDAEELVKFLKEFE